MANEEVLRLRTTIVSEESLAQIRQIGREIGFNLPQHARKGGKEVETGFKAMTESVKRFGEQLTKIIPGLEEFGLGAASAVIAGGLLVRTLTNISGKVTELGYTSKELGMSVRDLRAWGLAAQQAGIAPEAMIANLKSFRDVSQGFKYNIGGVRDELVAMGAGPVVARIMAARTETDKLKQAFDFKEALLKADPSGYQARKFFEMMGLGADSVRLSLEELAKAQAKVKPLTPEEIERAKKFHDAMLELGNAWEELLQKTALGMFPHLMADIHTLEQVLDKLEAIGDWIEEHAPSGGPADIGTWLRKKTDELGWTIPDRTTAPHEATPEAGSTFDERFHFGTSPSPQLKQRQEQLRSGYHPAAFTQGGGDLAEGSRMVKEGVFAALVDFYSYLQAGGGAGVEGFQKASFGGSAGAARARFGGGGYTNLDESTTTPSTGGGRRGLARALGMDHTAGGGRRGLARASGMDRGSPAGSTIPPSGSLAQQRAGFMKELEADPQLKAFAIDAMQHEGGIQSNMEQLMNMAAMRHQTLRQALHSGQYGPVNTGLISGNISERTRRAGEAALAKVGAGSNITDYATDQGMAGDPNFAKYMADRAHYGMHKVEGAWFSAHGEPGVRWAAEQRATEARRRAAADATRATASDADDKKTIELGPMSERYSTQRLMGENAKRDRLYVPRSDASRMDQQIAAPSMTATGNVNLTVNSNGTAAKTKSSADGIFQKTTVQNVRQMQRTDAPASFADRWPQ